MELNRRTSILAVLIACYAGFLLISNFLAGIIWGFPLFINSTGQTFYFVQDGGILAFVPIYLLSDIISELYGRRIADYAAKISCIVCLISFTLCLFAANCLPAIPNTGSEIYQQALGTSARVLSASLIAFWLSAKLNNLIFERIFLRTGEAKFWQRSLLSSYPAKIVDTLTFNLIAFVGRSSLPVLAQQIIWAIIVPCVFETLLNPLTKIIVFWLKRQISHD